MQQKSGQTPLQLYGYRTHVVCSLNTNAHLLFGANADTHIYKYHPSNIWDIQYFTKLLRL